MYIVALLYAYAPSRTGGGCPGGGRPRYRVRSARTCPSTAYFCNVVDGSRCSRLDTSKDQRTTDSRRDGSADVEAVLYFDASRGVLCASAMLSRRRRRLLCRRTPPLGADRALGGDHRVSVFWSASVSPLVTRPLILFFLMRPLSLALRICSASAPSYSCDCSPDCVSHKTDCPSGSGLFVFFFPFPTFSSLLFVVPSFCIQNTPLDAARLLFPLRASYCLLPKQVSRGNQRAAPCGLLVLHTEYLTGECWPRSPGALQRRCRPDRRPLLLSLLSVGNFTQGDAGPGQSLVNQTLDVNVTCLQGLYWVLLDTKEQSTTWSGRLEQNAVILQSVLKQGCGEARPPGCKALCWCEGATRSPFCQAVFCQAAV